MASTIFHHWLDQYRALPEARQRRIRIGLRVLGVAVVFLLGVAFGRGIGFPNGLQAQARKLAAQNTTLQGQVQGLQQQQQTDLTALAALKTSLAGRDSELQKLKQEQAFYSKLIGIDSGRSGLGVHSIELAPVAGTDAWNFVATLVNTAENADAARGTLTLAVEGVRGGKLVTLAWPALAGAGAANGVSYAFKFFQQVRGSFMLPRGFVPNRVAVTLHPERGAEITRKLDWNEMLAGQRGISVPLP
ncbi:MAG: hypothetical protein J0H27_10270 [Xanthomonadales bacterium]|nr:hypothetical protein [Xanthomonadales bacterium]ODU94974.1 MAG: hypothetical protein ABT18_01400 [Rhodanobacter sp. SCN 66-43]OJY82280.1 MAG: hypothetical protein BGP23_01895 [Xanthomonadales bacterium 66-474]